MKFLVCVFGLVALACICSATERDAFIRQMVDDLDANGDGEVTESELHSEFVITMDTNSNWIVTEDEFINPTNGWPAFYGDSIETAKEFFNNLDVVCMRLIRRKPWSSCGSLGPLDLIEHYTDMDVDKDGKVSVSEGYSWMDKNCACANVTRRCLKKRSLKMIGYILTLAMIITFYWLNDVTDLRHKHSRRQQVYPSK